MVESNSRQAKNFSNANDHSILDQKTETEIKKLELEIEDLQERIWNARNWYKGRHLFQVLVGGSVAGALFAAWFVQLYEPKLEAQKAKYEMVINNHLKYVELVTSGNSRIKDSTVHIKNRMKSKMELYEDKKEQKELKRWLSMEVGEMQLIEDALDVNIEKGLEYAQTYYDSLDTSDNPGYSIEIIYDEGSKVQAYQAQKALLKREYKMKGVIRWNDFKEVGDGAIGRFFNKGPVLWYSKNDERISRKVYLIKEALKDVFPSEDIVIDSGAINAGNTTWYPPGEKKIQLWVF